MTSANHDVLLTDRAAVRVAKVLANEPAGSALRIGVRGGGCSGFQYDFAIDGERQADDLVIEHDGAIVLIDSTSLDFLHGARIDFVDDVIGQAFKIDNPNAASSCGCGVSFSV